MKNKLARYLENRWLLLALSIAFISTFWVQWPRMIDHYLLEGDFRHFFWMNRFQDSELFQNDPLIYSRISEFTIGPYYFILDSGSPGYSLLFQAASSFMPFLLFSKLLVFPLTLLSVYFLFRIGELIAGRKTAFYLSLAFIVINLASPSSISTLTGLQRSFAFPIITGTLYYLMTDRDYSAALIILVAGLVYPPVFVLMAITYTLTLITVSDEYRFFVHIDVRRAIPLILAVIGSVVALSSLLFDNRGAVRTAPLSDIISSAGNNQGAAAGTASDLFNIFPFVGRGGIALIGNSILHIAALSIFALAIWLLCRKSLTKTPRTLRLFFLALWIGFGLAWLSILITSSLLLYYPSRYTEVGLIVVLLIYVAVNARSGLGAAARLIANRRRALLAVTMPVAVVAVLASANLSRYVAVEGNDPTDLRWILIALTLLLIMLIPFVGRKRRAQLSVNEDRRRNINRLAWFAGVIVIAIGSIVYVSAFYPRYYKASAAERSIFTYMETLPKDALIDGQWPTNAYIMRMYGKRQVGSNCPVTDGDRLLSPNEAYHADSSMADSVLEYCRACEVDYFMVNSDSFPDSGTGGDEQNSGTINEGSGDGGFVEPSDFLLRDVPESARLFQVDTRYIVACDESLLPG